MQAKPLIALFLSNLVALLGLTSAAYRGTRPPPIAHVYRYDGDVFANWDGQWYSEIADQGYSYRRGAQSSVAFFPAYPLLGRGLARATGLGHGFALRVVSNAMLLATFIALFRITERDRVAGPRHVGIFTLMALGLFPTAFYLRVDYSESTFLLLTCMVLYGMRRGWPLTTVAAVVGVATAARPVGVALVPALAVYAHERSASLRSWVRDLTLVAPLACGGILAYITYQAIEFGDGLAFVRTQQFWRQRVPGSICEKAVALAVFEPVWSVFLPTSPGFVGRHHPLAQRFWDPILFLLAVGMTAVGALKHWTTRAEVVASATILLIPYVTKSYENYMASMGRHASVALPVYLVMGQLLARAPRVVSAVILAISALLMYSYACDFAAWK